MTGLSMRELAERSGVDVQRLRQLINLGILSPDAAGRFQPADIQRVRIIQAMDGAGIAPAQLGQLIATGAWSLGWAQVLFPDPTPQVTTTLQQAAVESGLPRSLVAGLYGAWELARPEPEQPLRADDAELLRLAVLGYLAFGRDVTVTLAWPNPRSSCSDPDPGAAGCRGPLGATGSCRCHHRGRHPLAARAGTHRAAAVPPAPGALHHRVDRAQHRDQPGTGGAWATPARTAPSDRVPRPHWLHHPHRGARRPGRRRPGRSAGRACLRGGAPVRRPSRQAARRRDDVPLP